tara:strand:- start:349 stop:2034 length:1686 start_codon:yes stop_codon:yes gene_type:complete
MDQRDISLKQISSSQPTAGGVTYIVTNGLTDSSSLSIVGIGIMIYPDLNVVTGSHDQIIVRNVNVGSSNSSHDDCRQINANTYSLFVATESISPTSDFVIVANAMYTDGVTTPYSEPVELILSPGPLELANELGANFMRSSDFYTNEATLKVNFDSAETPLTGKITYSLGIQVLNGNGVMEFDVVEGLVYDGEGVTTVVTGNNGVDEVYVAVQVVRTFDSIKATSRLSNTIMAVDGDFPQPPRNLLGLYNYSADTPNVVLTWAPPFTADLTDVTLFSVYRNISNGSFENLGSVDFVKGQKQYQFTDTTIQDAGLNELVSYYVKSSNTQYDSTPSEIYSFVTFDSSLEPLKVAAIGVRNADTVTQDVTVSFQNPSTVNGETINGYLTAYFKVIIENNGTQLATQDVQYDTDNPFYSSIFNDIAFVSDVESESIGTSNVKVLLITYSQDGSEIEGKIANIIFTSGYTPIFTNINNGEPWTPTKPLSVFSLITPVMLSATNAVHYIVANDDGTFSSESVSLPVPTIPGPYESFQGNYMYGFQTNTSGIITVSAGNSYGVSIKVI